METSTGQPLLFFQLLGVRDSDDPIMGLVEKETHVRNARDTLAVSLRQTAKVLHYHQVKAELLEKYHAKQKEAEKTQNKLQRLLVGETAQGDSNPEGDPALVVDAEASSLLIDKRAEQRLRDKLARHNKNMADLRRKLVEEDKRERARRRKVRAKREAMNRGYTTTLVTPSSGDNSITEELYMEDWESILTAGPDEAEHYLERVHERRAEHELLMQAISFRIVELSQQDDQVAAKLDHDLKVLYRKIALRYHPDRSSSDSSTEMFQLLSKAYAVVGNKEKRRVYTQMGNHTLYLCVHEHDKEELRMADHVRDVRKSKQNAGEVLRITSGAPNKLRCPKVALYGLRVKVSWMPLEHGDFTYEVNMQSELNDRTESMIVYEGQDTSCTVSRLAEGDYVFMVRATNSLGPGEWSESVYVSVLEDGGLINPYSKSETMKWQQAKQEEIRELKRKRRKRKEEKKKQRRLKLMAQSEEDKQLTYYKQTSQQIMRMIQKENFKDLHRLLDRIVQRDGEGVRPIINSTNSRGETPMIVASMKGITDAVNALLNKVGQYVNLEDTDNLYGRTPLIWAIINGDADMLHAIASFNKQSGGRLLNVNWQDYEGYTALHWAADLGQSGAVECILRQPDVDVEIETYDTSYTPFHFAAYRGHLLIVQLLYQKRAAIKRAKRLSDSKAQIKLDDEDEGSNDTSSSAKDVLSPAFLALMNEHYDVAQWIIKADARRLIAEQNFEAVREMKTSLLHLAAMLEKLELVQLLIAEPYGADINSRDEEGNTPLHLAYQVGNLEIARYLEEAGCDTEVTNDEGLKAIDLRIVSDNEEGGEDEVESDSHDGVDTEGTDETDDDRVEDGDDTHETPVPEEEEEDEDEGGSDSEESDADDDYVSARTIASGTVLGKPSLPPIAVDETVMGECYIDSLPSEVLLRILSFTYARDVCIMRQVSRTLQPLAEDQFLWRKLCLRTFPYSFEVPRSGTDWRALFAEQLAGKKRCAICCRVDKLRVCSSCRLVYYCSTEHQRLHWRINHRDVCIGPFRLVPRAKRSEANEDRTRVKVQKALVIFGQVEASIGSSSSTV